MAYDENGTSSIGLEQAFGQYSFNIESFVSAAGLSLSLGFEADEATRSVCYIYYICLMITEQGVNLRRNYKDSLRQILTTGNSASFSVCTTGTGQARILMATTLLSIWCS